MQGFCKIYKNIDLGRKVQRSGELEVLRSRDIKSSLLKASRLEFESSGDLEVEV